MTNNANTPGLLPDVPEYTAQIIHLWVAEESVRILSQQKKPLEMLRQHLMQSDEHRKHLIDELLSKESITIVLQGEHAPIAKQLLAECERIHQVVSKNEQHIVYQGCYMLLLPLIVAYRAKGKKAKEMGEIEILCTILYNAMMQSLDKEQEQYCPTDSNTIRQIGALFALLDQEYHKIHHNAFDHE